MDTLPYLAFVAAAVLMVIAQERFLDRVARAPGSRLTPLVDVGAQLRARPRQIIPIRRPGDGVGSKHS